MRRIVLTFLAIILGFTAVYSAESSFKRYGIQDAIVEYELSGNQSGTVKLYFENYGMKEAQYRDVTVSMMGKKTVQNTVDIIDGIWQYSFDAEKKTGTKMKNIIFESAINSKTNLDEFGNDMMKKMGGEKVGKEQFLGKMCDVWEMKQFGVKIWVWKMIPLKTVSNFMGMTMTQKAITIDEKTSPAAKFVVPSDVKLELKTMKMEDMKQMDK